jgi:protease IV
MRWLAWLLVRPPCLVLAWSLEIVQRRRLGRAGILELHLGRHEREGVALDRLADFETAARHPRVRGVLLHLDTPALGWAGLQEWQAVLERLKDQGKLLVAWVEAPTTAAYTLASVCDRIVLPPLGEVGLVGVAGQLRFLGGALNRLGLAFELEAAGEYKSYGESFTRTYATPENREATRALIDGLHQEVLETVARHRLMTVAEVQALVERAPLTAEEALEAGLVDEIAYEDGLNDWLAEQLDCKPRRVSARSATRLHGWIRALESVGAGEPLVVVVHLRGAVVISDKGHRGRTVIASRATVPALEQLREDPRVKAVVLAVDSPGGSALASDLIWREVELLTRSKPVVAWFGDTAASGGYYLAAAASEILARPSTLTGSIGVVGGKLVVGKALATVGVHSEWVGAGPNAALYNPDRPFTPSQRERFRKVLQRTYDTFVQRVAAGRRRPEAAVEPFARGRVWTGRAALEHGLVDALGGLSDAILRARRLSGLTPGAPWRRMDLSFRPRRNLVSRLAPELLQLQALVPQLPLEAQLLSDHPGEPLALSGLSLTFEGLAPDEG